MTDTRFGTMPDGREVERLTIRGGSLSANILTYGAVLQDLRLTGHAAPLVLGFETLEPYLFHSIFHGAIVGRFANRLADGRFTLDGRAYAIPPNDRGHLLHGGAGGTDHRLWNLVEAGPDFVTLSLCDEAARSGFPGNLEMACTYRLCAPAILQIELVATTDAPTLCSLAHHSWFNLDDGGASDIFSHRLMIAADSYLPVDEEAIPTGEICPVDGTAFDFRASRAIGRHSGCRYDHNFCLAPHRHELSFAARLEGARSGVSMELWTTEPGLQFFDGGLPVEAPGLGGRRYRRHAGLCLEPQGWPDAPNHTGFPSSVLRPGERYRQVTEFRFRN